MIGCKLLLSCTFLATSAFAEPVPASLEARQLPLGTRLSLTSEAYLPARETELPMVPEIGGRSLVRLRFDSAETARLLRAGTVFTVERVVHYELKPDGNNFCGTMLHAKTAGGWPLKIQIYGGSNVTCPDSPKAISLDSVFSVELPAPVIIESASAAGLQRQRAELRDAPRPVKRSGPENLTLFQIPLATKLKLKEEHYIPARQAGADFNGGGEKPTLFKFHYPAAEVDRKIPAGTVFNVTKVVQYDAQGEDLPNWCGVMLHVETAKGWKMRVQGYGGEAVGCNSSPKLAPLAALFDITLTPPVVIERARD